MIKVFAQEQTAREHPARLNNTKRGSKTKKLSTKEKSSDETNTHFTKQKLSDGVVKVWGRGGGARRSPKYLSTPPLRNREKAPFLNLFGKAMAFYVAMVS